MTIVEGFEDVNGLEDKGGKEVVTGDQVPDRSEDGGATNGVVEIGGFGVGGAVGRKDVIGTAVNLEMVELLDEGAGGFDVTKTTHEIKREDSHVKE